MRMLDQVTTNEVPFLLYHQQVISIELPIQAAIAACARTVAGAGPSGIIDFNTPRSVLASPSRSSQFSIPSARELTAGNNSRSVDFYVEISTGTWRTGGTALKG